MAILKALEGPAHVELESDGANWGGYILLEPDIRNLMQFDIAGPLSTAIYEGPVFADGKYYFGNGKVRMREVSWPEAPKTLKIAFKGIDQLHLIRPLQSMPADYLPEP